MVKGGFKSEDTGEFFHCQHKYSKSLSWAENLNFPPKTVKSWFKLINKMWYFCDFMLHFLFYYRLWWKIIQSYWFHHFTRIPIPLPSQCRMHLGNPCSPRLKNQLCFSGFGPWNLNKLWLWLCKIVWWVRPKIQSSWEILSLISRAYCFHWKFTCCCFQNRLFTGKVQMNESKIHEK